MEWLIAVIVNCSEYNERYYEGGCHIKHHDLLYNLMICEYTL